MAAVSVSGWAGSGSEGGVFVAAAAAAADVAVDWVVVELVGEAEQVGKAAWTALQWMPSTAVVRWMTELAVGFLVE